MRSIFAVFALVCIASTAQSKEGFRWETETGTISFADDAKRVPPKYKKKAQAITLSGLKLYERQTSSVSTVSLGTYAERIGSRLAKLRESSREVVRTRSSDGTQIGIQISGRDSGAVGLGFGSNDNEAIEVEDRRVRVGSEIATRHAVIVRQGDRVLGVTLSEANVWNISDVPNVRR